MRTPSPHGRRETLKCMDLWERYADEFPIRGNVNHLNHAGVAPLCRRAAKAMRDHAEEVLEWGSWHFDRWLATYAGLRASAACMIGARPEEIAIVKNTSEGIAIFANGLDWKAGDRVVAFREEFPANVFPWMRLEEQAGVQVTWLSYRDSLDRIDQACAGARLLSVSFVQYLSGYRADLAALGEIAHRRSCLFFVDAIQGMGVFPIDVESMRISALAADGHKWLLGPEGCGVLFVRRSLQDEIIPKEFGWTNTAQFQDYASRDLTLRPSAARYECGTLNTTGCSGLRASIDLLLEVGVEEVGAAVLERTAQIRKGLVALGCDVLDGDAIGCMSGIVAFRNPGEHYLVTLRRMKAHRMMAAPRQGWVRVSPHFYTTPQDAEALLEVVRLTGPKE